MIIQLSQHNNMSYDKAKALLISKNWNLPLIIS